MFDYLEAEGLFRVPVEAAHDPGHVDALLAGIEADRAGHGCFQRQVTIVAGVKPDRQPEIRDPDMFDMPASPLDQAFWAVLQVRQRGAIGLIRLELFGIGTGKGGVVLQLLPRQETRDHRIESGYFGGAGLRSPGFQNREGVLCLAAIGQWLQVLGLDVHRASSGREATNVVGFGRFSNTLAQDTRRGAVQITSSACIMSAIRSPASSSPHETRIRPGVIPRAAFWSSGRR